MFIRPDWTPRAGAIDKSFTKAHLPQAISLFEKDLPAISERA
jgi:hypothetical protein